MTQFKVYHVDFSLSRLNIAIIQQCGNLTSNELTMHFPVWLYTYNTNKCKLCMNYMKKLTLFNCFVLRCVQNTNYYTFNSRIYYWFVDNSIFFSKYLRISTTGNIGNIIMLRGIYEYKNNELINMWKT